MYYMKNFGLLSCVSLRNLVHVNALLDLYCTVNNTICNIACKGFQLDVLLPNLMKHYVYITTYYISILLQVFRFIVNNFEVCSRVLKPLYRFWNGVGQELLILQQRLPVYIACSSMQAPTGIAPGCTVIDRPTTCCCWLPSTFPAGGETCGAADSQADTTANIQLNCERSIYSNFVCNYLTQPSRRYCNISEVSYLKRPLYITIFQYYTFVSADYYLTLTACSHCLDRIFDFPFATIIRHCFEPTYSFVY